MGLGERILGFMSAPFAGERYDRDDYKGNNHSGSQDANQERTGITVNFGAAQGQQLVPYEMIQVPGDFISNRGFGTHPLIPGRALSAQTRMKNTQYELPADVWTENPEGPAYILRVPGLPGQVINLQTTTQFTSQPMYLQPLTNLEIQNEMSWIQQFRAAIFGNAQAEAAQAQQNQNMFPSIFSFGNDE